MSFNFKKYVRELLVEQSRVNLSGTGSPASRGGSIDTSNYKEDPQGSGIYRSSTGKDPYAYSIMTQNANKIVIKIEDAPLGRSSAVGRTFDITKNKLDDPNIQMLYASLVYLGAITTRLVGDEASLKSGSKTAEILIVGNQFNSINHFKDQHNRIKSLGHELRASTLTRVEPPSELTSQFIRDLSGTASKKIEQIVAQIEKFAGIEVVSMTLEPAVGQYSQDTMIKYMGKKDAINYIHSEFQADDTINLNEDISSMIETPSTDMSGETMQITVDDSAEPVGETFQSMPGESDPGVNPSEEDACISGYKLEDVLKVESGEMNMLEAFYDFCPADEEGLYVLNGIFYKLAKKAEDFRSSYPKQVFKAK